MIEFIFFKIIVPVAAAVICGLLVWFVIDCLEASSWAEEDVKMPGFHVSAGIGGHNSCKNDPTKCGLCKAPDLEGAEEKK